MTKDELNKQFTPNKEPTNAGECLEEMEKVIDPWGLFEPYLWKDKIGDGQWHCEIRSCCGSVLAKGVGNKWEQAVTECHKNMLISNTK